LARDGVEVFDGDRLAVDFEFAAVGGEAEVLQVVGDAEAAVAADEVAAVFGFEAVFEAVDVDADAVADGAFVEGLQDAAVADGADAFDVAFADGFMQEAVVGGKCLEVGAAERVLRTAQPVELVAFVFVFGADEAADIAETVVNAVMVDRLKAALPLLSDSEQELIQAIFFDGLSEREVGARLGITQSVVNKRKARILRKLRKIIEN